MNLVTAAKAEVIAAGLGRLTGRRPVVLEVPGGKARIAWEESDLPAVQAWFEGQVSRASVPPDVSLDLLPVVSPYATRKIAPIALLLILGGVVIGRLL